MEKIDDNLTVEKAISNFYDQNDFGDDGGVSKKIAWLKFGFFSIPIPNVESRRENVYLHDISHIVTDNDTTWKGESAVSAWEIASGGWGKHYILWLMTLWAMGLGAVFYPQNVLNSFKKGLTMRNGLTSGLAKETLFKLSVSELKTQLSNYLKSNKNPYLWIVLSLIVFVFPFLVGIFLILIAFKIL
jgi:hypothetical protein